MNELRDNHGNVVQARDIDTVNFVTSAPTALNGLPPSVSSFTGRDAELAELAAHRLVVVSGLGGVGKTELVLRFAEHHDFPGGRLLWNFHGYDLGRRTTAEHALDSFLRALGVSEVPSAAEDKATLYRSVVAAREPMLIVLDNVSTAAQVRPLLVAKHHVVITSRHLLTGLDAHLLDLRVLPPAEAERIAGDPKVAQLCGGLPLALQIMAALRRTDPHHDWASELREARLPLLEQDDRDVRAVFDLSYQSLSPGLQRFFRLVGMHFYFHEITTASAAAVAGLTEAQARTMLRELRTAHLLEEDNLFHDLVREFAAERRNAEESVQAIVEAGDRLVDLLIADMPNGTNPSTWRVLYWTAISMSESGHVDVLARDLAIEAHLDIADADLLVRIGKELIRRSKELGW